MNIEDLEKIIELLKQNDVVDFELDHDGMHVRLSRLGSGQVQQVVVAAPAGEASQQVAKSTPMGASQIVEPAGHLVHVESPFVGTFYRRSTPDSDPFVSEGDLVKKGAVLCIVEAMKVMNEIEAPCDGRIERVMLNEGRVVEYGEVLFVIDPRS